MKNALFVIAALALGLVGTACQSSHQEGVKSDYRTQWSPVAADVKTTTDAAAAVLKNAGLQDVQSNATGVDGKVTGKKADGTTVNVGVAKKGDAGSEVSVTVGTMGDPALGADLAKQIKMRAEGK